MTAKIKALLEKSPEYREKLFIRGYLVTNGELTDISTYPYYNNWKDYRFGEFTFRVHNRQKIYSFGIGGNQVVLVGNCVNPFSIVWEEEKILKEVFDRAKDGFENAVSYINELTGSFTLFFINGKKLSFLSDPAGMLFSCYAVINNNIYISSHTQLLADLFEFKKSEYIVNLENYKHFYKYGLFFPGDLTQYTGVNRVLQNHIFDYDEQGIRFHRFYPAKSLSMCSTEQEYNKLITKVIKILNNTMKCVAEKWSKPAISLTGGMDSKTTLASANGLYDKFSYYSYITMPGDKIDAEAAHKIAEHLNLEHKIFTISENDSDIPDIETVRTIIQHNNGDYIINPNDVRKRLFFSKNYPYDVEVKSWVSEIARANYYKKCGFKKMPERLSPRQMTTMYKVFTSQRKLAIETDRIFENFIRKTNFDKLPEGYDSSDMYLWEFRYSAWGGQAITSEHLYSNDIFIPFNNRNLLNLMLSAPLDKRITDKFHEDLIEHANKKISEINITITNWNETRFRMYIEKINYLFNTHIK